MFIMTVLLVMMMLCLPKARSFGGDHHRGGQHIWLGPMDCAQAKSCRNQDRDGDHTHDAGADYDVIVGVAAEDGFV